MNKYQELTIKGLDSGLEVKWDYMNNLSNAFCISDDDINPEDCILSIGLNPAGDDKNADDEKSNRLYLCSTDNDLKICGYNGEKAGRISNNHYFRPIMNVVNNTVGEGRWTWSKESWETLEKQIDSDELLKHNKLNIKKQFDRDQERKITVYHGDMFYVHKTDSNKVKMEKGWNGVEYCNQMLSYHVEDLKAHNKVIRYIYIPNKTISQWIAPGESKEYITLDDGTYVFLSIQPGCRSWNKQKRENKDIETINRILKNSCE